MSFKDIVEADNKAVFINNLEFAEEHNLNGIICNAIVQNMSIGANNLAKSDEITYSGIYGTHLQVNCLKSDLPEVPVTDQAFELDNVVYQVESCADDMGILSIQLLGNER